MGILRTASRALFALALAAIQPGCWLSHERSAVADGGRVDAGPPDAGGCGQPCCYGAACTSDADCTDPATPHCGAVPGGMMCLNNLWCGHICASPDTPVATPEGERPIASLRDGDLVFSMDQGVLRAVPIARTTRTAVRRHAVVRVVLTTGRVLEISPGHPTADARTFADLEPGGTLDGTPIVSVETIPYGHDFTYDILPASDTGTYVAGGVLIGSTLAGERQPSIARAPWERSVAPTK